MKELNNFKFEYETSDTSLAERFCVGFLQITELM